MAGFLSIFVKAIGRPLSGQEALTTPDDYGLYSAVPLLVLVIIQLRETCDIYHALKVSAKNRLDRGLHLTWGHAQLSQQT